MALVEFDRVFRRAFLIVILTGLALGLIVVIPMVSKNNFSEPLETYLNGLARQDALGAYNMVCEDTRRTVTFEEFQSRLQTQIQEIGEIDHIRALRGGQGLGSSAVYGSRKTVIVHTPMRREGGRWKPCPIGFPFDEIEPYN